MTALNMRSRLHLKYGGKFIGRNGEAETSAPRVDASRHLIGAPDEQAALHYDRQHAALWPEQKQYARSNHDPQHQIRRLNDRDCTGSMIAKEPSQRLRKGQSLTSPSSRPFQYVTRFALTWIRTMPGVSTPLSNQLSRSLVQCCWKAALSRMSSAVPSTAT